MYIMYFKEVNIHHYIILNIIYIYSRLHFLHIHIVINHHLIYMIWIKEIIIYQEIRVNQALRRVYLN